MAKDLSIDEEKLGDRIADGIARGMAENAPPKKVTIGRFDPKTPFRSKRGPRLKGKFYYNGIELNEDQLTDLEIELCNSIQASGSYLDKIVTVRVVADTGARVVYLSHPDKTPDQRFMNMAHWQGFQDLVGKIVEEQGALVTS